MLLITNDKQKTIHFFIWILPLKFLGKEIVYLSYVKPVGYLTLESGACMFVPPVCRPGKLAVKTLKVPYRNKRNICLKSTIFSPAPCYSARENYAGETAGGYVCISLNGENFYNRHFIISKN
jgi:hypothetical protein